jgi:hypothetical protein
MEKVTKVAGSTQFKVAGVGAMAYQTAPSLAHVAKSTFTKDGKLGNISLEDVGNVASASMLGRNFLKERKAVKALNRQTDIVRDEAKTTLSMVDPTDANKIIKGDIIGDLPVKDTMKLHNRLG